MKLSEYCFRVNMNNTPYVKRVTRTSEISVELSAGVINYDIGDPCGKHI